MKVIYDKAEALYLAEDTARNIVYEIDTAKLGKELDPTDYLKLGIEELCKRLEKDWPFDEVPNYSICEIDKISFAQWLEDFEGISYEYFDNNYDGTMYDEVMERWEKFEETEK